MLTFYFKKGNCIYLGTVAGRPKNGETYLVVVLDTSTGPIFSPVIPSARESPENRCRFVLQVACFLPSSPTWFRISPRTATSTAPLVSNHPKGRLHSEESKARIAAANRGMTPWNKGCVLVVRSDWMLMLFQRPADKTFSCRGNHSTETRRKIAEAATRNAQAKKAATAFAMGISLEVETFGGELLLQP
jgi:hypothetical protein